MKENLIARAAITIHTSVEDVWAALVTPEAIKEYMFGAEVVSDWREGSPIVWRGEWNGSPFEDKGVILALEPGRRLEYSHYSPLSGLPDEPSSYHRVTVELSPADGGTRVVLSQDGNATEEERSHAQQNWGMMLGALKKHVEV